MAATRWKAGCGEFAQDIVLIETDRHQSGRRAWRRSADRRHAEAAHIPSSFIDGLRVTDAAAMEGGDGSFGPINKQIVAGINAAGGRAVGVSGKDGNMVLAKKVERSRIDPTTRNACPSIWASSANPSASTPKSCA